MSSFQIIVGSMLGASEYIAEACQETLESLGHEVTLHFSPDFSQIPHQDQFWLICTSTHGAGDFPDNIQKFVEDLTNSTITLTDLPFAVIGLGDTSYDTFCFAAKNIEKLLLSKGCKRAIETKTYDVQSEIDPEEDAQTWIEQHKDLL